MIPPIIEFILMRHNILKASRLQFGNSRWEVIRLLKKWLKDRKGRVLTFDDGQNYIDALSAMSETIRLMSEIDCTFEAHGGWPLK